MIVDSSALIAIVLDEPSAAMCLKTLVESPENRISAAGFLEASIVVDRLPDPDIPASSMISSASSASS